MKAIAATIGDASRRDFFWLGQNFGMMASSPLRGLGFNLRFGGTFTSVPAAVASMGIPEPVVSGEVTAAGGDDTAGRSDRGGDPNGTGITGDKPELARIARGSTGHGLGDTVLGQRIQRLDLFGLGTDYALYTKKFWGSFDQDDLSPWHRLDGIFTSAPAAIAWGNRIDVFGVGLDHAMYVKTSVGELWTPQWRRLGGRFTSAASLVSRGPAQLDLFARGADFTLRRNQTDGSAWFGWQNLGGSLASPPVTASWGPDRLDVFAIFKDGALWHRWWDGQIWNEWTSLGGSYVGEPAVASWGPGRLDVFAVGASDRRLHHHWFAADTWNGPETLSIGTQQAVAESATVISAASNRLEMFVPTNDRQIRIGRWDGQMWQFNSAGATTRIPSRYRFSVDHIKVNTTRALNADTDAAMASVAVGNAPVRTNTQWIGEIGGLGSPKQAQTNLLDFEPVTVDLAESMSFSYLVVNNGHAPPEKILDALANAGDSLSLAGSSSMQEDIANGIVKIISVKILAALAISVPVIGSIIGAIEAWLLGKLTDAIFESCDGVVAVELRAMMGRDLFMLTNNGRKTVTVTTQHAGTESPGNCRDESDYEVTWSIKPL